MPRIVCRTCGREVYATASIEQLFAEERRCPRCGASLQGDRRTVDRRSLNRRQNPSADPGPPAQDERRMEDRRESGRRKADRGSSRRSGGSPE